MASISSLSTDATFRAGGLASGMDTNAIIDQLVQLESRPLKHAPDRSWPERFRPWDWRPGEPLPEPVAGDAEGAEGLYRYLEEIMAFFVRHFEMMITYLAHPGCPRTNNHAERENRRYRALSRPRYGWTSKAGLNSFLIVLQGFGSG